MKRNLLFLPYFLVLISPSLIYYIVNAHLSLFLPIFLLFQIAVLFLIASVLKKKGLIFGGTLIFFLTALFHWGHFSLFHYELTHGAVAAILGTNAGEAKEFLQLLPLGFFALLGLFMTLTVASLYLAPKTLEIGKKQVILSAMILVGCALVKRDIIQNSQPFKTLVVFYKGQALLSDFREKISNRKKMRLPVLFPDRKRGKQVHVLVIGESSRRKSWSLYGNSRNTNRFSQRLKDELLVFSDVISAANSTIQSLAHSLTYAKEDEVVSLLDVANDLGFKSFWLSNQAKYGVFDNPTTSIAESATVVRFLNSDTSNSSFDNRLISEVESALRDEAEKKLIIVHLMGSHYHYSRRYPQDFAHFKDGVDDKSRTINEYENSLLFSDYVLAEIIDKVSKEKVYSSVFYFSDHGENLYDDGVSIGHGGVNVSRNEVEVPMVVWLSPSFKQQNAITTKLLQQKLKDSLSLFDFFPSYLDFLGAKVEVDDKFSFFSSTSRKERFVFNPENLKIPYGQLK